MKQCLLGFARRVLRESAGLTSCAWSALSHGLRPMFSHSQVIACKQSKREFLVTPGVFYGNPPGITSSAWRALSHGLRPMIHQK